jgi:hypothetical protein
MATHRLNASPKTVHWGFFDAKLPPQLTIDSGDSVIISTVSGTIGHLPKASRGLTRLICGRTGISREDAYTLCSLAADVRVTQVVNGSKGHCLCGNRVKLLRSRGRGLVASWRTDLHDAAVFLMRNNVVTGKELLDAWSRYSNVG